MEAQLLKPLTTDQLQVLSRQFKQALVALYGNLLDRVVLFGSYARGDFKTDSDVDFLVVLKQDTVQFGQEVDKISHISSDLGIDYTIHISAKPVSATDFKSSTRLFYQAVRSEGITI